MRGERGLLHPVALVALALLIVNDHVLKVHAPSWVTGKLSDVAGLVVFPLLLTTVLGRGERVLGACIAVTAVGFGAVKLWSPATRACELAMGALQWPIAALSSAVRGEAWPALTPVAIVRDPTDLVALAVLPVAWAIGTGQLFFAPSRIQTRILR